MKNLATTLLVGALLLVGTQPARAEVLLETATYGGPQSYYGAWSASIFQYLGARFELSETTRIECIGGNLAGHPDQNGTMFAAIVALDDLSDLPDSHPLAGDAITTVLFEVGDPSSDLRIPVDIVLSAGTYGLIYGSGEYGANRAGSMPFQNQTEIGNPSYFSSTDSGWLEGGGGNHRFYMANGRACSLGFEPELPVPSPVPSMSNWSLAVLIGLMLLGGLVARRYY